MPCSRMLRRFALSLFLPFCFPASSAFAETIELVTYYPTSANAGNQHVTSLTVGTAYQGINPADGTAIIVGPVGIGTNAPVSNLHIEESPAVNSAVATQLLLSNSGGGNHAAGIGFQTAVEYTTYGPKAGIVFERTAPWGAGDMKFFTSNNTTTAAGFTAADERMRITQTGNVGIGTAAPAGPLHVNQNLNGVVVSGLSNPNAGNFATTGFRVGQDITTLGTQQYGELRYWGSGTPALAFGFGNPNQLGLIAGTAVTNGLTVATLGNVPIKFLTNTAGVNNERMRIQGNGQVGIGTPAPQFNLDVVAPVNTDGNIRIRGGLNVARLRLENAGAGGRNWAVSSLSNAFLPPGGFAISDESAVPPAQRLVITNLGQVGIGRTPTGTHILEIQGTAGKTSVGNTWANISDARVKQNIQPLQAALSKMLGLKGVTFEWKDPSQHNGETGRYMGMIAQEAEKVFPQWVSQDDRGFKWLQPAGFEALSIEAMRELNHRIDELKTENDALKQRMETLERKQKE